jgi:hypothetical protein
MAKRSKQRAHEEMHDIPVADEGAITQTTIYPTLEAAWQDIVVALPWFEKYSPETRRTLRYAFYTAASEVLRTAAFRMNSEQNDKVFSDFDAEIRAYDRELQAFCERAEHADAELH